MKLEEEDVREEFSSYTQTFEADLGKYFKPEESEESDRTVWVNQETGEVRNTEPTEDEIESYKKEHQAKSEEKEQERLDRIKEKRDRPGKVKRLYKKLATHLHPDRGGSDERFQMLKDSYNNNDLIELLSLASEFDIEYEVDESDEETFKKNLNSIESEINRMKDTLAWLWSTGDLVQRRFVLARVEQVTGKKIDKNDFKDLFESE